ncbi:MAG: hypothetical protein ABJO02_16455 [Reichenbachiella sp.]|uniref:hypothetical protein n=1 Tax=Reichenbachiella sp. TaxID=2184521 RepID=UPI00329A4D10
MQASLPDSIQLVQFSEIINLNPSNASFSTIWIGRLIGLSTAFLYVFINKYHAFLIASDKKINPKSMQEYTTRKYPDIRFSRYSWHKSYVVQLCAAYGLIAAILFLGWSLLDLHHIVDLKVNKKMASVLHVSWPIYFKYMITGVLFGSICYPALTADLISSFGLRFLPELISQDSEFRIKEDIDKGINNYLRQRVEEEPLDMESLEIRLFKWYNLKKHKPFSEDLLVTVVLDAKEKEYDQLETLKHFANLLGIKYVKSFLDHRYL